MASSPICLLDSQEVDEIDDDSPSLPPPRRAAAAQRVEAVVDDDDVVVLDDAPRPTAHAPRPPRTQTPPQAHASRAPPGGVKAEGAAAGGSMKLEDSGRGAKRARRGSGGGSAAAADGPSFIDLTDEEAVENVAIDLTAELEECINLCDDDDGPALPTRPDLDGLDVLRDHRAKIRSFLKARAASLRIQDVKENPHSLPGTPLFTRFVQAWTDAANSTVQCVFHGTAAANVDAICREGLDPRRRAGQAYGPGEYFGEDATISLAYCKGGNQMLVFAVLKDPSGLTAPGNGTNGIVVVHRVDHQLPLFVITFSPPTYADQVEASYATALAGLPPGPQRDAVVRAKASQLAAASRMDAMGGAGGVAAAAAAAMGLGMGAWGGMGAAMMGGFMGAMPSMRAPSRARGRRGGASAAFSAAAAAAAMAFAGGGSGGGGFAPPPPVAAPTFASMHVLRHAPKGQGLWTCGLCKLSLAPGVLALGRTSDVDADGRTKLEFVAMHFFHIRCVKGAPWKGRVTMQELLDSRGARPPPSREEQAALKSALA